MSNYDSSYEKLCRVVSLTADTLKYSPAKRLELFVTEAEKNDIAIPDAIMRDYEKSKTDPVNESDMLLLEFIETNVGNREFTIAEISRLLGHRNWPEHKIRKAFARLVKDNKIHFTGCVVKKTNGKIYRLLKSVDGN